MRNDSYVAETSLTLLRCFRLLLVAKSNVLGQASSKYGRFPVRASGVLPANQKHVPCLVCRLEKQGLQGYRNPGPASKSPIYGRFPPPHSGKYTKAGENIHPHFLLVRDSFFQSPTIFFLSRIFSSAHLMLASDFGRVYLAKFLD